MSNNDHTIKTIHSFLYCVIWHHSQIVWTYNKCIIYYNCIVNVSDNNNLHVYVRVCSLQETLVNIELCY